MKVMKMKLFVVFNQFFLLRLIFPEEVDVRNDMPSTMGHYLDFPNFLSEF